MKRDLTILPKADLVILVTNYYATLSRVSKLYLKSKTENNYLERRNKIVEARLKHLKELWEKKNRCKITFDNIDAFIKKEKKLEKQLKYIAEVKDGYAKNERIQS